MVCVSALWCLSQHLPSYLGFSYLGHRVSLHGCSSKAQSLLLTLAKGYLLTAAPPDLEHGVAPLSPPAPVQPLLLGRRVAPLGHCTWPRTWGSSSSPFLHRCLHQLAWQGKTSADSQDHKQKQWEEIVRINILDTMLPRIDDNTGGLYNSIWEMRK